ncbi:MAG TPA: hypothetical protein VNY05_33690, partial [Candidatus Acidoferrales bacterium]|nr:hypothetical protein [Candidatus Acidoferrales bacterium]
GAQGVSATHDAALDSAGNLFIADGFQIHRVDGHGQIQTVAGDGYVHIGDGGAATDGWLFQPSAVALGRGGNLYIADTGTERVRQVTVSGIISTIAGTGGVNSYVDAVPAVAANLNSPMGVAVDAAGNILIADTAHSRILQIGADGVVHNVAGTGLAGLGTEGLPPFLTQVFSPEAVCLDRSGTLYIADTSNHRILQAPLSGKVAVAAGNGALGAAGDNGKARLAELYQPSGCALDSSGNLFIADTRNNRLRKVTPLPAGIVTTVAGTGDPAFGGDEAPATASRLSGPRGVAVDDNGNIFIADTGNHRIRQITPDGVIHTIAGQNGAGFAGDGGPSTSSQLNSPGGLFLDATGTLYLADTNNNRVRRLVPDSMLPPDPIVLSPTLTAVNAASQRQGPVAPGEIVSIFGLRIGPVTAVPGTFDASGLLSNLVGGTEVRFDGVPAPLFYVQSAQVNAQVPYTVAGATLTHMEVLYLGQSAGTLDLPVAAAAPALFTIAINQDGSTNSQSSPAPRGTILTFFATGEGLTDGANISGQPAPAPYPRPVLPVSLAIAGVNADLLYAGAVPGGVGVLQVNARVPGGFVSPGPTAIELTLGNFTAPATFWLK